MRADVALAAVVSPSLRDLLLLCGWSSGRDMGRCVGDRRQGLCVSRPCSDSRGRRMLWYIHFTARDIESPPRCCNENSSSYASSHSPPAPCAAALSTTDGLTFAPAKPTSFLGCLTDFTLRRRQPCRLATPKRTRATLPPETADGWVTSLRC